jgi:hypothetical protein
MKIGLRLFLLGLLPLSALWLQGCPSNNHSPASPAPVTIVELVTATFTSTPTVSPTVTPGGAATSTPVPPPAAMNGYFTTHENTPLVLSNSNLNSLLVSYDNADPLIFLIVGSPDHGTAYLTHTGFTNSITYTPNSGFYGTDSFAYQAYDQATNEGASIQSIVITVAFVPTVTPTLTPTVTPTPVPSPALSNGNFAASENTTLVVSASSVASLVTVDPNGDPLTFSAAALPGEGTLTLNADGSFTYTPNSGFTGTDSFTVEITDTVTTLSSPPATFTVNVS